MVAGASGGSAGAVGAGGVDVGTGADGSETAFVMDLSLSLSGIRSGNPLPIASGML
jgi:hypothetical protein